MGLNLSSKKIIYIYKYITIGVIIACLYGLNISGIDIDAVVLYRYTRIGYYHFRVRSFASGAGHFDLYLNTLTPIGFYYLYYYNKNLSFKIIYTSFTVASAFLMTFSAATFVSSLISISIVLEYAQFVIKQKVRILKFRFILIIILSIIYLIMLYIFPIAAQRIEKIFLKKSIFSVSDRLFKLELGREILRERVRKEEVGKLFLVVELEVFSI